jgi:hypothetical protein
MIKSTIAKFIVKFLKDNWKLILIVCFFGTSVILCKELDNAEQGLTITRTNLSALTDSVTWYRIDNGDLVSKTTIQQYTIKELISQKNAEVDRLQKLIQEQGIKIKRLTQISTGVISVSGSGTTVLRDTVIKTDSIIDSILIGNHSDSWLSIDLTIKDKKACFQYVFNDTLNAFCTIEKEGKFKLKNLFVKRKLIPHVYGSTTCPYSKVVIRNVNIIPKGF